MGDFRQALVTLWELARPHRRQFAIVLLFAFLAAGADLLAPLVYRHAINTLAGLFQVASVPSRTPAEALATLWQTVALLFAINVTGYFLSQRADFRGTSVSSTLESGLIVSTFGHVLRLPLGFFARQTSGGLAKRIDQSDQVGPVVHAFSQQIAPELIRLIGIFAIMLTANWRMSLIAFSMLLPYLWLARRVALHLQSGLEPYYEMWENISARIADAVSAIKTVKLSGAEPREEARLRHESTAAYSLYLERIRKAQRYYLGQNALSHLSRALLLGYGGWLVLRHQLTPGDVVMFLAYMDRLYSPIDSLNGLAVSLTQHLASLRRALALRREGPLEPDGLAVPPGEGRVEFRNIHFSYVPEREVLSGVSLTLAPGRVTALAGPSGAGKTTLADLLLRLYEPTAGEILLDGVPVTRYSASALRAAIGVVAADGVVFRGTLAENIRYKRPAATTDEILAAARAAGLSALLARLPDGLETHIGERGVGLSLGERQRVQIARMLVDHPRLLVLDEATANLDYVTESEIKSALLSLHPRPAMLIIAHRYTMVKEADYVYVLHNGQISAEGTPAALAASGGWFTEWAQSGQSVPASEAEPTE